ncbi:MAG: hypothetical protein WCR52_01555 [Bacteroidota bacterium]
MNNFVLEIWDDELDYVTFYTVRWEDHSKTETDKFVEKFYNHETYREALQALMLMPFHHANEFSRRIDEAFREKIIEITDDERSIVDTGGDTEIIL